MNTSEIFVLAGLALCADGALAQSIPATIPVEVIGPAASAESRPVQIVEDSTDSNFVIAVQRARIARAVVVDGRYSGRDQLLALALLENSRTERNGPVNLDGAPEERAWCEMPAELTVILFDPWVVDCFQDRDGDGSFDTRYRGAMSGVSFLTLSRVEMPRPIDPRPYRPADVSVLPTIEIGYLGCGKAGEDFSKLSELRFGTLIRTKEAKFKVGQLCTEVAREVGTSGDERLFEVGRFKVGLRVADGVLSSRLIEGLPTGTLLANLRIDRPLMDASKGPPPVKGLEPADRDKPVLFLQSIPTTVRTARRQDVIFKASVAHGITGKLRGDLAGRGHTVPAGTALFGMPMSGTLGSRALDAAIVWCAPTRPPGAKVWETECYMPHTSGFVRIRSRLPFDVTSLSGRPAYVGTPVVDRGPVDFGPLELLVRFVRIKADEIVLEKSVSSPDEPVWERMRLVRREEQENALSIGGAILVLRPGADNDSLSVEIQEQFAIGNDAQPRAVRIQ